MIILEKTVPICKKRHGCLFWVAHDIAVLWTKLCSFGNLVLKKATSKGITNLFIPFMYLLPIAYKYKEIGNSEFTDIIYLCANTEWLLQWYIGL